MGPTAQSQARLPPQLLCPACSAWWGEAGFWSDPKIAPPGVHADQRPWNVGWTQESDGTSLVTSRHGGCVWGVSWWAWLHQAPSAEGGSMGGWPLSPALEAEATWPG